MSQYLKYLQLHLLTPYGPSNLNRDRTGRPKTAQLGGINRLRISSQSLKRAWRTSDCFERQLEGHLSTRTRLLGEEVREWLIREGMEEDKALQTAVAIASVFGKVGSEKDEEELEAEAEREKPDETPARIKQTAFVSQTEWDRVWDLAKRALEGEDVEKVAPGEILCAADTAADIALFGRMLARTKGYGRDGALQVTHAVTTHEARVEADFFTAVDDLSRPDSAGAGFADVQEFGSGVFYLHCCVDRDLLKRNLSGQEALVNTTLRALTEAAACVSPRGKRTSFASNSRAVYVLAERGLALPVNLIPAFEAPVPLEADATQITRSVAERSIEQLENWYRRLRRVYAHEPETYRINMLAGTEGEGSLSELLDFVVQ